MKRKIVALVLIIFVIVIITQFIRFNGNKKTNISGKEYADRYMGIDIVKSEDINERGILLELMLVLDDDCDRKLLAVTNNFNTKYPNANSIISNIEKYENIDVGFNNDGEISIKALNANNIFSIYKDDKIIDEYIFKYELSDDKLDDMTLKCIRKILATTGEEIK